MEKVRFTEEKATNLATLYGRALDYRSAHPILGDQAADDAVRRIDYDFTKIGISPDRAVSVVLRAKPIDDWAAEYLRAHPDAIVLHLGCGLDTRFQRLAPPETVHWYDVDYPEVVELREKLYDRAPNQSHISTSVTDFGWLDQVPSLVFTVQSSESTWVFAVPRLTIGSMARHMPGTSFGPRPFLPCEGTNGSSWKVFPIPCPPISFTTW